MFLLPGRQCLSENLFNMKSSRCFLLFLLMLPPRHASALPAFPGAEGYGANSAGGRGGSVYYVTTLNDSGPGSLRTGVSVGNRTILFKVSGTIELLTDLKINKPYITIAGQTAPGDGIALKRRLTSVQNTHDVIVRYLRFRPGDADCPNFQDDSFHVVNGTNVIVDHVSTSWSIDELCSVTWSTNVTVQWSMITESLKNSCHVKRAHGYGSLLRYGNGGVSFHHDLYEHNDSRNPRLGDSLKLDFVNNVIYNWGGRAGYSGADSADNPAGYTNQMNYVNNYLIAGPSTTTPTVAFLGGAANTVIYQSGNYIDSNRNGLLDGSNTGWNMFRSPYTPSASRFPLPSAGTDTAAIAYQRVLAFVGASLARDAVDTRLIDDVRNQTGAIIDSESQVGGWPTLSSTTPPADSDNDGLPDFWEVNLGMNPAVPNNNHVNADGYTDLEHYLNWLAEPHALGGVNQTVSVDLRALTGGDPKLAFTVENGTNGSVGLAGDGYNARFVPETNFVGLAAFTFNASNTAVHAGFGPVTVALLITNRPPTILQEPVSRTNYLDTSATFTIDAAGADLHYQWRKNNLDLTDGGRLSGANSATLVLSNVIADDSADYRVAVTNYSGSVTSSVAALTIVSNAPVVAPEFPSADGRFHLLVSGVVPGPDYTVQASTNLQDWADLFTTNPEAAQFKWIDSVSSNFNQRFYRVLLVP